MSKRQSAGIKEGFLGFRETVDADGYEFAVSGTPSPSETLFSFPRNVATSAPVVNRAARSTDVDNRTTTREAQKASTREVPIRVPPRISAKLILRRLYVNQILSDLAAIQPHANTHEASVYAHRLLRNIREMRDTCPDDQITDIVMALYNAISYKGAWASISGDQFSVAYRVLSTCAGYDNLDAGKADRAIAELRSNGLDPLSMLMDIDVDEWGDEEEE